MRFSTLLSSPLFIAALLFRKNVARMVSFKQEMRFYRLPLLWDLENKRMRMMCTPELKQTIILIRFRCCFHRMPKTIFSRQNETFCVSFFLLYIWAWADLIENHCCFWLTVVWKDLRNKKIKLSLEFKIWDFQPFIKVVKMHQIYRIHTPFTSQKFYVNIGRS
jgi:hypothetical protein